MKNSFLLFLFCIAAFSVSAQHELQYRTQQDDPQWVKMMYEDSRDMATLIEAYESYYKTHAFVKNKHTQFYKRLLRSYSRMEVPAPYGPNNKKLNRKNITNYLDRTFSVKNAKSPTSEWNCIGPYDFDIDAAGRSYAPGAAHVYTVERAASDTTVLYAGTATAGMWKSEDAGATWSLCTRDLLIGGITSIEIDHMNANVAFFGSAGNLYKTVDGGVSWAIIGEQTFGDHDFKDIVMHPEDNQIIYATTNNGFHKSTDAGVTWQNILSGSFQEIELHPVNPDIIYTIKQSADRTTFYRSMDGGDTFNSLVNNGWPFPASGDEQKRTEIAVTPASPDMVYALATGAANGGSGLYGIYVSEDQGENWTFRCCGPQPGGEPSEENINLMGWSKDGLDDGGQYYYDLALAVDPFDANKIHVGGVNQWISTDGGYSFTCYAKWSEPAEPAYVHADIHDIRYFGEEIWIACDGGIFLSTDGGTNFTKRMVGIEGSDFWGFGASFHGDVMLGGAYHNGTLLKDEDTYINGWICTGGGDGVRGFVNPGNNRLAYDDREGRILTGDRDVNFGHFSFAKLPNSSYIIGESSDMAFDPRFYNTVYLGHGEELIITRDNGKTFETVHEFGTQVMSIDIPWSNPEFIYVTTYAGWWGDKKVWKSTDAGNSWSEITPPAEMLNGNEWVPWDITASSNDENIIWVARTSQYGDTNLDGHRVYKSEDGGTTWQNITTATLDGEAITNIVHQKGTNGGVYLGTRRAVYYRNNDMDDWQLFNNNLPARTMSVRLVPYYWGNKIRNATNRSVYEAELYETSAPLAQISVDKNRVNCFDNIVHFVDHSVLSENGATWEWSFPGGTPATSNEQNPTVTYETPGNYEVSLTVTDEFGTSSQSYSNFITFENNQAGPEFTENFEEGISDLWTLRNANNSFNWTTAEITNGAECEPTQCVYVDHFGINQPGHEAELLTPVIDLTNTTEALLSYDYAYARWGSGYEDGFRIDISTDCGQSWTELFYAFGDTLTTVSNQQEWWEPGDCSDWSVGNIIDITDYVGEEVVIRFVAINGWGNNFYLDNINFLYSIVGTEEIAQTVEMNLYPNPSKGNFIIEHNLNNARLSLVGLDGKVILEQEVNNYKMQINRSLPSGIYHVLLTDGKVVLNRKLIISNQQ